MRVVALSKLKHNEIVLATVASSNYGIAKTLLWQGQLLNVYKQADHIPYLQTDDEILCCWLTQGAYIIARSLRPRAKPMLRMDPDQIKLGYDNVNISVSAEGDVKLQNPFAAIGFNSRGEMNSYAKVIKQSTTHAAITLWGNGRIDFAVPE